MSPSLSQAFADAFSLTFIGMSFSWAFYGGTIAQTLYYYRNFPMDTLKIKLFTSLLFVLDTIKEITVCVALWNRTVSNRGDIFAAQEWTWSDYTGWVFSALTVVCTQWFYLHHIWILSRSKWSRSILIVCGVTFTSMALASTFAVVYETNMAQANVGRDTASIFSHLTIPARLQSITELAVNGIISLSMVYILRGAKSEAAATNHVIRRLVTFVVNRGLLLFVLQLLEVVLYDSTNGNLGDTRSSLFYYPLSTVNVNTVLIALNERRRFREDEALYHGTHYTAPLKDSPTLDSLVFETDS